MWRTWPRLSANTVAQKPGDSVMPLLSPAQAVLSATDCASTLDPSANTMATANSDAEQRAPRRMRFTGREVPDIAMAMLPTFVLPARELPSQARVPTQQNYERAHCRAKLIVRRRRGTAIHSRPERQLRELVTDLIGAKREQSRA